MSLLAATLIPGVILILIGLPLVAANAGMIAALKSFPRSTTATWLFFGTGSAWFLYNIWNLSPADFGEYHLWLFIAFAFIAALAFRCVPDFLAVRGLAILMLLAAMPLLMASYMNFDHPQIFFQKGLVYVGIVLALWLGAQPWRMRDFLEWLFARPERTRWVGGVLGAYGILLTALAFTY
jgi:hypothetical protein